MMHKVDDSYLPFLSRSFFIPSPRTYVLAFSRRSSGNWRKDMQRILTWRHWRNGTMGPNRGMMTKRRRKKTFCQLRQQRGLTTI